jgi:hypothetical protein
MDENARLQLMADEYEVRRVRARWAFARDHGEWETMRACFHPEASVLVSWFAGPAAEFFTRTIAMSAGRRPEERSKHSFGNMRATLNRDRAILETDINVLARDVLDGYLFDFTIYGRFFDLIEKRDGTWKIFRMTCIYDKDRLDPVVPGSVPASFFAGLVVSGPDSAIAFTRFRQTRKGRTVPPNIVIGGSANERNLRAEGEAWLAAG